MCLSSPQELAEKALLQCLATGDQRYDSSKPTIPPLIDHTILGQAVCLQGASAKTQDVDEAQSLEYLCAASQDFTPNLERKLLMLSIIQSGKTIDSFLHS